MHTQPNAVGAQHLFMPTLKWIGDYCIETDEVENQWDAADNTKSRCGYNS